MEVRKGAPSGAQLDCNISRWATYRDGTLSVEQIMFVGMMLLLWGAAPYPATFEKVDQTFNSMVMKPFRYRKSFTEYGAAAGRKG